MQFDQCRRGVLTQQAVFVADYLQRLLGGLDAR